MDDELFELINLRCTKATDEGKKVVTFKLSDLAGVVRKHPHYDPPKQTWVQKVSGKHSRDEQKD